MTTQLMDKKRKLRMKRNLLIRQIASKFKVEISILSTFEREERPIKGEQIAGLIKILLADRINLETFWLAN